MHRLVQEGTIKEIGIARYFLITQKSQTDDFISIHIWSKQYTFFDRNFYSGEEKKFFFNFRKMDFKKTRHTDSFDFSFFEKSIAPSKRNQNKKLENLPSIL